MTKSEPLKVATVGVHQAKTRLSELLRRVDAGEEIVILRSGRPAAKLVPVAAEARVFGTDPNLIVPDDFDAPLSDDVLADFER